MTRGLTTGEENTLQNRLKSVLYTVKITTSPITYLWQGVGDLVDSGHTYIGSDSLLSLDSIVETGDLGNETTTITLSGLNTSILSELILPNHVQYSATIGVVLFDDVSGSPSAIKEIRTGLVDFVATSSDNNITTITITLAGINVSLQREKVVRHDHAAHLFMQPGDTIFKNQAALADREVIWKYS